MKALKIIVAVIVTLIASWAGLMIGDSLLAGTRGLSIIFAICSICYLLNGGFRYRLLRQR